jgi:hypothetical protein
MTSVLNVQFKLQEVQANANIYVVNFTDNIDIGNIDNKNELMNTVLTYKEDENKRRVIISPSKSSDGVTYNATFLESFDSVGGGRSNIILNHIYHTYVVVDSRNTNTINKTSLHVFKI